LSFFSGRIIDNWFLWVEFFRTRSIRKFSKDFIFSKILNVFLVEKIFTHSLLFFLFLWSKRNKRNEDLLSINFSFWQLWPWKPFLQRKLFKEIKKDEWFFWSIKIGIRQDSNKDSGNIHWDEKIYSKRDRLKGKRKKAKNKLIKIFCQIFSAYIWTWRLLKMRVLFYIINWSKSHSRFRKHFFIRKSFKKR